MTNRVAPRLPRATCCARGEAGFTLLEVLIAVVVLSFGILGVVGLQAASLQANRDARLQSSAVRLGRELADMMRGNNQVATLSTAGTGVGQNPYLWDSANAYPAPASNCFLVACPTTTAVAQYEMNEWLGRVATELPGARAVVCIDSNPYANSSNQPQWLCDGLGGMIVVKIGWTRLSTNRAATAASAIVLATAPTIILPMIPSQ